MGNMKLLLLAAALILTVSCIEDTTWTQYKKIHKKLYTTAEEDGRRYEQYLKNRQMVEEHNQRYRRGETSYNMAVNKFSDWFPEEVSKMTAAYPEEEAKGRLFQLEEGQKAPDEMNWVKRGSVTSVKDQGCCSSSYAFGIAGALEGLLFRSFNNMTSLSAQELLDCCSENHGCKGGSDLWSFLYVMRRGGLSTDASYPYHSAQGKCRASEGKIGGSCEAIMLIIDEDNLRDAVGTIGPATVVFSPDNSFLHYKSGVFDGNCSSTSQQVLLAVGYGTKNQKKDYWLLKNSWGTDWGQKGYAKVIRGKNKCGIGIKGKIPFHVHIENDINT